MKLASRRFALVLFLILTLHTLAMPAHAETPFVDNPHWKEVPVNTVTQMRSADQSFVVMFFRHTCFNSNLRKTMLEGWMENYDLDVYGVDCDQYSIPGWALPNSSSQSITLPLICIVENGAASNFTAKDSMHSIQKRLQECLGVYDEAEIDFSRLNTQIYEGYSLRASTAASQHCMAAQDIPSVIQNEAESIVQGLSGDREKLKAIYDWVTTNIYYNYGMLNGTVQRRTSALETYTYKNSVCSGFANLTKTLCNAVGIPCRVVTGFATGVDTESTVGAVWQIYSNYVGNRDLTSFADNMASYENHAWNEAYVDGKWIILDTTWGSNNDYYPDQRGQIKGAPTDQYFDPDLTWFSESHLFWTDYSCDLDVTVSGDTLIVNGTLGENDIVAASRCLLVSYDHNGRLLDCIAVIPNGPTFTQSLKNHRNTETIKLFLLNNQYAPAVLPLLGKAK